MTWPILSRLRSFCTKSGDFDTGLGTMYQNAEANMVSITTRKLKDGSAAYLVRVQVTRDGTTYHGTKTFDRRSATAAWTKKRE